MTDVMCFCLNVFPAVTGKRKTVQYISSVFVFSSKFILTTFMIMLAYR